MGHRRIFRGISIALGLLVCANLARSAQAQDEKFNPRINVQEGQQLEFQSEISQSNKMQMTSQGNVIPQGDQGMEVRRKGTVQVLAVKDGTPTAVQVTFDAGCGGSTSQNGQSADQAFPLAGKTVTIKKDESGVVTFDADVDQQTTKELTEMISPDHSLFPKSAVSVGDEWDGDPTAMSKQFALGPTDSVTIKCKYEKVGMVDNRKTADMSIVAAISKTANPVTIKIEMTGLAQVDLLTGQTLKADINGKMSTTGQIQGAQGQVVGIEGNGLMEIHQTEKFLGAGTSPDAVVNAQPVPAGNPLGNAAGASPFVGAFHSDTLSCVLMSGSAGQLKGSISLGQQSFPATATEQNGKITGSFTARGNSFAFTAVIQGDKLILSSGGQDYPLTRVAENPLGAAARPANPLGQ